MEVSVFEIEIDISMFTARLLQDKLVRAIEKPGTALSNNSNSIFYFNIQLLVGFLSFGFQAVHLERVFIRQLWDFVNYFLRIALKTSRQTIPSWVKNNLKW